MREIKFRAWDKSINCMMAVGEIHFCAGGLMALGTGVHIGNGWAYRKDDLPCDVVLMQYTGIKDKCGKEIYEGDVLRSERTSLKYQVTWDEESASFTALCTDPQKDFYMGAYSWVDSEIIGNIYDNPELL